jgi:hypothetical protein
VAWRHDRRRQACAAELAKAGISVEFIDPRTLKPLDVDALVSSVRKTKRLLVVEHGHYTAGYGSHVIAEVAGGARREGEAGLPRRARPGRRRDDALAAARRAEDRRRRPDDAPSVRPRLPQNA